MNYTPDRWIVVKLSVNPEIAHYMVLAGWLGSFFYGKKSWRISSGVTRHDFDGDYWRFYGSSGSCYKCYVDTYGFTNMSSSIYDELKQEYGSKVELVGDRAWNKDGWKW